MSPQKLREMVTSPGGTTAAGLKVLGEKGLNDLIREAISAAVKRGRGARKEGLMFIFGNFIIATSKHPRHNTRHLQMGHYYCGCHKLVNPDPYNPVVRFLYTVTEPVLAPVRRIIGFRLGRLIFHQS